MDGTGEVARIAITAMDPKLSFPLDKMTLSQIRGRLGRGAYDETDIAPSGVWIDVGARRFHYAEAYWFGNPGGYQTYLLTYNDASSVGDFDFTSLANAGILSHSEGLLLALGDGVLHTFALDAEPALTIRRMSRPNTIVVVRQDKDDLIDKPPFGPDYDMVRVLPE